ncbi:hypothetical protein [Parasutterella excrementihominis]|uniref:hypothetical protein n=1 Tax=Parasutterella excrementihominis TaxID=487175 RepID=UPI002665E0A6|nr:hypothetical protein [Parasutterella excrementihominis]
MNKEVKFVKSNTSVFDALSIYSAHRNELTAEDKERLITLAETSLEHAVNTLNLISGLLEDRQNLRANGAEFLTVSDDELTDQIKDAIKIQADVIKHCLEVNQVVSGRYVSAL